MLVHLTGISSVAAHRRAKWKSRHSLSEGAGREMAEWCLAASVVFGDPNRRPRRVRRRSGDICGADQTPPTLLVIGGGHVGKALVHLGKWLGFRVALCDDRPDYCTPHWAPGADVYLPVPVSQLPSQFKFNDQTYIVMPTRGVGLDVDALPQLLDLPHAYLGVIGSRRRWVTARKRLEDGGIAKDKLAAVHAPMGLELNAETPEQIALSIMAEIVMLQRGGDGKPMMLTVGEA